MSARKFALLVAVIVQQVAVCQEAVVLEHRRNTKRTKELRFGKFYEVEPRPSFMAGRLVGGTDSTLLFVWEARDHDTTVVKTQRRGPDTLVVERIYRWDTVAVRVDDVKSIRKVSGRRNSFLEVPAWVGAGGLFAAAVSLPVAGAVSAWGNDAVMDEWAIGTGIAVGLVGSVGLINALMEPRYDLAKRWRVQPSARRDPGEN